MTAKTPLERFALAICVIIWFAYGTMNMLHIRWHIPDIKLPDISMQGPPTAGEEYLCPLNKPNCA
jgi:hypothetical protein